MGRKFYKSGISESDFIPAKQDNVGDLSPMSRTVKAPPVTEDQQVKAAWYLHRTGNADLWGVLGLDVVVEGRRRALGVAARTAVAIEPACPTCGAAPGDRCRSDRGGVLHGRHMARRRLTGRRADG